MPSNRAATVSTTTTSRTHKNPPPPRDLVEIEVAGWRDWQLDVFEALRAPQKDDGDRVINVLVDRVGMIGKNAVIKQAMYKKWAQFIPDMCDGADGIKYMACCVGERNAYIVRISHITDIHSTDAERVNIYRAIENIKDGLVTSITEIHGLQQLVMGSPNVWVFTYSPPPDEILKSSPDRWRLWTVDENFKMARL